MTGEHRPLRILLCGAGNRTFPKNPKTSLFRGWFETIHRSPSFEVVGVQDISSASLERVQAAYALSGIPTFADLRTALQTVKPDAVLISPIAEAHASAALAALDAGCHVLIEKPFATSLTDALRIGRLAKQRGLVVSIVQNWRAKSTGLALREAVQSKRLGQTGSVFFRYVRDREQAHLPAYLFDEPYPLLYAMAIHHFDLFRFFLGENIVSVEGRTFTPHYSRYKSPPGVHLWMQTENGIPISYVGTFSSKNSHLPQESLIVDGSLGTLSNESPWGEPPLLFSSPGGKALDLTEGSSRLTQDQYNQADDYYLQDFHHASVSGKSPLCPPEDNLWTLAAIDAAVQACRTGQVVDVRSLIAETEAGIGVSA